MCECTFTFCEIYFPWSIHTIIILFSLHIFLLGFFWFSIIFFCENQNCLAFYEHFSKEIISYRRNKWTGKHNDRQWQFFTQWLFFSVKLYLNVILREYQFSFVQNISERNCWKMHEYTLVSIHNIALHFVLFINGNILLIALSGRGF